VTEDGDRRAEPEIGGSSERSISKDHFVSTTPSKKESRVTSDLLNGRGRMGIKTEGSARPPQKQTKKNPPRCRNGFLQSFSWVLKPAVSLLDY